jgi:hypothetical protein
MLPPLHFFIKQEARQAANRLQGNGCSYVLNLGHSEVLIKLTDEMPVLLAPRENFGFLNIFDKKFSVNFSKWKTGLRNVLTWLHRIDSFSLLMDLFAGTKLVPSNSLTF